MEILKVKNLCKSYGKGETKVEALKDINLTINKGEFVAIVGPSGSGKSTLLHLLGGVDKPSSGEVYVNDVNIYDLKTKDLAIFRRRNVGIVYQFYNLIPVLSVCENIMLPADLDGRKIDVNKINLKEGSFDKEEAIKENGVILINKSSYIAPGKMGEVTLTNHKVGDIVNVSIEDDLEKIGNAKLKIMGITDDKITGFDTYREGGLDFITYDEVGKNLGANISKDTLFIDVDNDDSIEKIKSIGDKYQYNIWDRRQESEDMRQTYFIMQIFVYGFLIVISLVSVTNIINTISTNISLRKRELAVIKSIGVTPKGFNRMVYLESILYGTISLIYAIPIGIGLCIVMHNMVSEVISFNLMLPWEAIAISIIAVYTITLLSAMVPMNKLNKENSIESIRQESI